MPDWWNEALKRSGFSQVTVEMLRHEGGIAIAQAPSSDQLGNLRSAARRGRSAAR